MSNLYLREAFLTVGNRQFNTRISFEIKKDDGSDANKATISVYNLGPDSRAYLESTTEKMRLEAGYQGDVGIIFWGNISPTGIKHERKGGDIVTTLRCGDGMVELQNTHLDFAWEGGVTCQYVLDKAVAELQNNGLHISAINGDLSKQYVNGKAFSGTVKKLMDQITEYCGLKWNVQNNAIQVYPKDGSANQNAVLINEFTGMIGLPSKTEKGISVKSLLNYRLIPGGIFKLETKDGSKTGSGTYNIIDVKHVGDTTEGDYYSEVEGSLR